MKEYVESTVTGAQAPPKKQTPRCTEQELESRVSAVETLLRKGPILKSKLLKKIKSRWDVERRAAEEYVARAKDRIMMSLQASRQEHRCEALTFFQSVLLDPNATDLAKLRAQEDIVSLLGLAAPHQLNVGVDANLTVHQPDEVQMDEVLDFLTLEEKKALLQAVRKAKAKKGLSDERLPSALPRYAGPSSLQQPIDV